MMMASQLDTRHLRPGIGSGISASIHQHQGAFELLQQT
jgi:hypothetical protein